METIQLRRRPWRKTAQPHQKVSVRVHEMENSQQLEGFHSEQTMMQHKNTQPKNQATSKKRLQTQTDGLQVHQSEFQSSMKCSTGQLIIYEMNTLKLSTGNGQRKREQQRQTSERMDVTTPLISITMGTSGIV